MNKSSLLGAVGTLLLTFVFIESVNATLLSTDDILRVEFSFSPASLTEDALFYAGPNWSGNAAVTVITAPTTPTSHKLYDENILLGTYVQTSNYATQLQAAWASPTSLFTSLSPTIADLSSIEDGTISGRADIRLSSGLLDIDLVNYFRPISFIEATSASGGTSFSGALQVTNISIVSAVPIPAAVWLFGSGLLGLIGIARMKAA